MAYDHAFCRQLEALPEEQAIDAALQLAGAPDLATGSSQSLLLSFLQKRTDLLSSEETDALEAIRLSLHVPQPWRDRLSHLLGNHLGNCH